MLLVSHLRLKTQFFFPSTLISYVICIDCQSLKENKIIQTKNFSQHRTKHKYHLDIYVYGYKHKYLEGICHHDHLLKSQ